MQLILASTSRYRRELLERLRLPFSCIPPEVDEARLPGESISAMTLRLAQAKAEAVADMQPQSWVIGSDQSASLDDQALGKPGTMERAVEQLLGCSGREVHFFTALVVARHGESGFTHLDTTVVRFRQLSRTEVERYVQAEQPLDCAGSFKCEGLGISLFEAIDTQDPTALTGLPLIALSRLLRTAGFQLP
ncbi:Maf family protein [Pseudomarimonas arenosa]|uniref:7-methyl-GTP pyrophosphatase n=1 Tax=Pseudomarimonas arenosa TaxID=2774145 RepID=A0AAW3ZGX0_9GAMM|nr:Maf family nucleotide pyrophosphatase [Pseudomarimonas arenosa]MBD8524794.1 septum formation inhibitor Maf [Pseudomarimonas arenosa]